VDGEPRGEVRRLALDAPVWAARAYGVELNLGRVDSGAVAPPGENAYQERGRDGDGSRAARTPRYRAIPTTPAVTRDLTLLLPPRVLAADVERVVRDAGGDILEALEVTADYRGPGLAAGTRAVTWQLTFRHPDRTLRDKEVEGRREKLLRTLESELGVVLRH
jgi:phenylalanyl-tRNA synthetase beta chain